MQCQRCGHFLEDYLGGGLPHDLDILKKMRKQKYTSLIPEICHWIQRFSSRVQTNEFKQANTLANNIARRGRKQIEYEYLLSTATFNLLKCQIPWIETELNYMKVRFAEAGVFRGKHATSLLLHSQEFLAYLAVSCFVFLQEVHDDHVHPKGLNTNVGSLTLRSKQKKEDDRDTLYDRDDDYQKEILEEDDDDLYT
jgi:hypothetical protein